jgi:hypothetical protein
MYLPWKDKSYVFQKQYADVPSRDEHSKGLDNERKRKTGIL